VFRFVYVHVRATDLGTDYALEVTAAEPRNRGPRTMYRRGSSRGRDRGLAAPPPRRSPEPDVSLEEFSSILEFTAGLLPPCPGYATPLVDPEAVPLSHSGKGCPYTLPTTPTGWGVMGNYMFLLTEGETPGANGEVDRTQHCVQGRHMQHGAALPPPAPRQPPPAGMSLHPPPPRSNSPPCASGCECSACKPANLCGRLCCECASSAAPAG
jgi:hypothetical protein